MELQDGNLLHSSPHCAMRQSRTEKQLMHGIHSHNYYFIKALLSLAGTLSHCCGESGTTPEGGLGGEKWGGWQRGS